MSDPFEGYAQALDSVITNALAITPNDTTEFAITPRGFYCSSGDMRVMMMNGQIVDFKCTTLGLPLVYGFRVKRIYATGTTATNFVLLW
jgi:hypothetical protein